MTGEAGTENKLPQNVEKPQILEVLVGNREKSMADNIAYIKGQPDAALARVADGGFAGVKPVELAQGMGTGQSRSGEQAAGQQSAGQNIEVKPDGLKVGSKVVIGGVEKTIVAELYGGGYKFDDGSKGSAVELSGLPESGGQDGNDTHEGRQGPGSQLDSVSSAGQAAIQGTELNQNNAKQGIGQEEVAGQGKTVKIEAVQEGSKAHNNADFFEGSTVKVPHNGAMLDMKIDKIDDLGFAHLSSDGGAVIHHKTVEVGQLKQWNKAETPESVGQAIIIVGDHGDKQPVPQGMTGATQMAEQSAQTGEVKANGGESQNAEGIRIVNDYVPGDRVDINGEPWEYAGIDPVTGNAIVKRALTGGNYMQKRVPRDQLRPFDATPKPEEKKPDVTGHTEPSRSEPVQIPGSQEVRAGGYAIGDQVEIPRAGSEGPWTVESIDPAGGMVVVQKEGPVERRKTLIPGELMEEQKAA